MKVECLVHHVLKIVLCAVLAGMLESSFKNYKILLASEYLELICCRRISIATFKDGFSFMS